MIASSMCLVRWETTRTRTRQVIDSMFPWICFSSRHTQGLRAYSYWDSEPRRKVVNGIKEQNSQGVCRITSTSGLERDG